MESGLVWHYSEKRRLGAKGGRRCWRRGGLQKRRTVAGWGGVGEIGCGDNEHLQYLSRGRIAGGGREPEGGGKERSGEKGEEGKERDSR